MKKRYLAFLIVLAFAFTACGGRLPSPSRSQHIIEHYFKKYAKKYPASPYGQGIAKVEVEKQTEIRKHFITVETYLTLKDGNLRKINVTEEKTQVGWRFVSWEDATGL